MRCTALKRARGQGNPSPVKMVSPCSMNHWVSSLLAGLPLTYKPGESKGTPLFGVHHPRYLTHRKRHQISFLLLAMPYISSAQSTSPLPSLLLLGQWWLICTLMEVPEAKFIIWKEPLRPSCEGCHSSARRLTLVTHTHMLCLCLCMVFSSYKTKICMSS